MRKKEIRIGMEIHKIDHMLHRNLSANLKATGIDEDVTMMHGWIIRYIYEHQDQNIFQKDIEQHFSIGRSTVTNIIQLMEKKGYICRESVERDARLKRVVLTQKGIRSYEAMESLIHKWNANLLQGITEEELEIFFRVIHKIKENAGKEKTDDPNFIEGSKRV